MAGGTAAERTRHEGVTVVRDDGGELVARKAVGDGDVARLQREVAVLRRLEGLAVVALRNPADDGSNGWVDLHYVGPRTLADAAELPPTRLLTVLTSVATTLGAAHDRGVSHGRLDARHVLLGAEDAAVLCGWSAAGLRDAAAGQPTDLDPTPAVADSGEGGLDDDESDGRVRTPSRPGFDPAADVAALGELAAQAAQTNRPLSSRIRTQLSAVATAAGHPDPSVRPPMAELARVLGLSAGPAADAPGSTKPPGTTSWRAQLVALRASPRRLALGAVAAVAAAWVTVVISGSGKGNDPPAAAAPAAPATAAVPLGAAAPASPSETTLGAASSVPASTGGAPPSPGADAGTACPTTAEALALAGLTSGCAAALGVSVDGAQLHVAGLRYALGAPGDQVGLSDPACTGVLLPTVVEAVTGRVYLFDQWALSGQPVAARLAGEVAGALRLARPLGDGPCGVIEVVLEDTTVVALGDGSDA